MKWEYIVIGILWCEVVYLFFDARLWRNNYYEMWFECKEKLENIGIDKTNVELKKEVQELRNRLGEWID